VYNRGHTDDGQLWIAMQFVDGSDADAALRAGTMAPQRAVHIITEVAKALDFAHAHQVVHRDIKPGNFLLSGPIGPDERVLLGDFGIARALDDAGLTVTGSVMATLAYAAPEVLSNAPIDGRVDIYSLGCTLYRLLTGQTPYPATNGAAGVMAAHLFSPPPRVTDTMPSLPAALDHVIATAMAKDPAARFPSATALADAADGALHDPTRLLPLPPVPSGDVSSYPRTQTPAPPWWHHSEPRTMAPWPNPPPPVAAPPWARRPRRPRAGGAALPSSPPRSAPSSCSLPASSWPPGPTTSAATRARAGRGQPPDQPRRRLRKPRRPVMQTYLRPDLLEQAGVADLGDWGAAFTATTTTIEVNSTGTKLRPVTRVGKFTNLPALLAISSVYTDVVTRDQVPVALPPLRTGQRQIISLQPDIEVVDFITDLGYRLDHLDSRNPRRDNPLKISNDGRNVSLDPRLAHLRGAAVNVIRSGRKLCPTPTPPARFRVRPAWTMKYCSVN
jgi:eukaryotic-like serine/threonine-protein kinase